ncbi:NADH dehydrogenase [ubiquinone] 1 beta subcomplex subunit 7 [Anthonomus grandis grandis]|uniref:NADH dehydrogenase [ubiquinone] 1 beta subcomplex subunit 7 n=1 Tax=Anthonomus grandis grandis TaxID=2921223 RepID=UPI002165FDEB|nr:NADH dehydrogenase [ubiquinone] 1 beta subcomplex subunit 7 [Anthonomus grandis grandis]
MGNFMGHVPQNGIDVYFHPEISPDPREEPTFDPLLGFPNGRKPREMVATEAEMISVKLPLEDRDYCAHKLIAYRSCYKEKFPWIVKCSHEKHDYLNCKYDDFIIRMKEYERERRLRVKRQEALAKKAVAAN